MIWLRDTGHIGIHGGVDGRHGYKPNFLTSMQPRSQGPRGRKREDPGNEVDIDGLP